MVISRIFGGLGNQMFQYAVARALQLKKQDTLKLDTTFFPKQNLRGYELDNFKIIGSKASAMEIERLKGKDSIVNRLGKRLGIETRPLSYYEEKETAIYDAQALQLNGDIYLDGYWQNHNYFKSIRNQLLEDFVLKKPLSSASKRYLEEINLSTSIGIHIRRGDYVANPKTNQTHGLCDLDYYQRAVKYFLEGIGDSCMYFIFSDDINWCKEHLGFIKNLTFVENTESAIEDFELLKNCEHQIIANSTFSWWAAWLNVNKEKLVIAPKVWWAAKPEKTLALRNWVKL
jgi:hypothetical protein